MVISTDGTFYAECITWLCHPKQVVEVYGMCMVRCPAWMMPFLPCGCPLDGFLLFPLYPFQFPSHCFAGKPKMPVRHCSGMAYWGYETIEFISYYVLRIFINQLIYCLNKFTFYHIPVFQAMCRNTILKSNDTAIKIDLSIFKKHFATIFSNNRKRCFRFFH